MKVITILLLFFSASFLQAQSLYFPPLTGTTWDTLSPNSLGWCPNKIDSLYTYLHTKHTKSFVILKDGKIVLEKYFDAFTPDSIHYWASAGKSLAATLTGIAIEQGNFGINDTVSNIIGDGWTSETLSQERKITVRHLLTMTSGMDDNPPAPCDNENLGDTCLLYLTDPGLRWAYHTGAYQHTHDIISTSTATNFNIYTRNQIGLKIGMNGFWFNGVYYSKTREAARFGLLTLAKDIWNGDTILHNRTYYNEMTNTSQAFNLSYGYLWWLNGKTSFMAPGIPVVIPGQIIPSAPADMFAALGKNDQKIYVVPSLNMVVVRMGDSADGVASAFSPFDEDLWAKIMDLGGCGVGIEELNEQNLQAYPNPFEHFIYVSNQNAAALYTFCNSDGKIIYEGNNINAQDFGGLSQGIYLLKVKTNNQVLIKKMIKQ